MWKRLLAIYLVLLVLTVLITAVTVSADTSVDITVTANPLVSGGISDFTITYVSETQLDFSWSFTGDAVNIMIRGEYGEYPDNITDPWTAPSDGYLVYYGSATSASDTTMDFDENPGAIYYVAWAQNGSGMWYFDIHTGWQESAILTFIGLIIAAGIVTWLSFKSRLPAMKFFGGLPWILLAMYIRANPPGNLTEGDNVHTAMWLVFIGVGLLIMVIGLSVRTVDRTESGKDYTERSEGFKFGTPDFLKDKNSPDAIRKRREEDNAAYREKARNAARPRRNRR